MFSSFDLPVSWLPGDAVPYDVAARKLSRHRGDAGCRGIFCERTATLDADDHWAVRVWGFDGGSNTSRSSERSTARTGSAAERAGVTSIGKVVPGQAPVGPRSEGAGASRCLRIRGRT